MPKWDLAADEKNFFGPRGSFFDQQNNSLIQSWHQLEGLLWLNPPFNRIEPWACKCADEAQKGAKILLLVPASVGSYWFQTYVHGVAHTIFFLAPRLCFDGKAPFPKDTILAHYSGQVKSEYEPWRWK